MFGKFDNKLGKIALYGKALLYDRVNHYDKSNSASANTLC